MHRQRSAKIVATLGPASSSPELIRALFEAGADVFRLNFSHGTHEDHALRYRTIRSLEEEIGRPIGILADLQGPKLRVGQFAAGRVTLATGARFNLDLDTGRPGDETRVSMPHPEVFQALAPGVQLLLDDGKVRLEVESCEQGSAVTRVVVGGPLSDRKGVSVVGAVLPVSALTEKDRRDLAFALELGVDWVALSFVQRPEDLDEVREIVRGRAGVMAKLEKPSAIDRLEEIVDRSDAIMVARGDLGVEMLPQKVPPIQRRILRVCRKAGKPAIVATQMLESMIQTPTPTRAEASDVASAVYHGTDAVMLSAESASGQYPVEAVSMMSSIIQEVEKDPYYRQMIEAAHPEPDATIADTICCGLRRATNLLPVKVAVTYTTSGYSSLRTARERPTAPILSMAMSIQTARRLTLVWGVHSVHVHEISDANEMSDYACEMAVREGFAAKGDVVVIAAGMPFGAAGNTNMLKITTV
ncbi:pyruvate kinase [Enterovirga sp.]|uniref:pyruvate kinase n=1 Tax=Enterovirga sp. TaxID=2026350 RepID=UPI002BA973B3|nr:pyruvate kinase [Enterovirga sp.]HMO29650.1 pyruvate kinase [Enterovirga sp.]